MNSRLRSLYICYLTLEDPLVHTQVVAYLEGLARNGHTIHLLTFEPDLDDARREEIRADMSERGIEWHALRYHKRPSLPATIFDAFAGAVKAFRLIRKHDLGAIHARSHVPAAMALLARRFVRCQIIFDMRGLMAEEYADAGRWRPNGIPFRITKRVEAAAIRASDAMVVLTRAVRRHLFGNEPPLPVEVIPCCVDLGRVAMPADVRVGVRAELDAGARPILLYVGKFTGWYMEQEMVEFFAAARAELPDLLFVVVTQADRAPVIEAFERQGIAPADYRITSSPADEIGLYLAAADAGIAFIRPCLSKISSSPTKVGEYLAAGLPVLSGPKIGDLDHLLGTPGVGVLLPEFTPAAYRQAATRLKQLLRDGRTADRCRALAHDELALDTVGVPRYDAIYTRLAAR
jgi:glycosyltransferase involved in cell wall biosynthesis